MLRQAVMSALACALISTSFHASAATYLPALQSQRKTASGAQEPVVLPPVTITGTMTGGEPVPPNWFDIPIPTCMLETGGGVTPYETCGNSWVGAMALFAMASQAHHLVQMKGDVRCSPISDQLRTTVSTTPDELDRWFAADALYRYQMTAGELPKIVRGLPTAILDGQSYYVWTVTYADNGSERWPLMLAPGSSLRLLDRPFPGSLRLGSGTVQPHPVCKITG
jgi:hypothetical protein